MTNTEKQGSASTRQLETKPTYLARAALPESIKDYDAFREKVLGSHYTKRQEKPLATRNSMAKKAVGMMLGAISKWRVN